MLADSLHQQFMIDCVKELTYVHIKHPGSHITALLSLGYGLMRSLAWTIAVGIFLEDRFEYGSQYCYYYLLRYSIFNRRYAQRASTAIGFGYFYQLYRFGKVASRTHAIPYLIKVLGHFFVKCLLVNLIDTRTALVFLHLVVSFPHQSLVYYKRFCLVHCFILNFLSWTLNLSKHATPFAPSPLQKLQHYYEVVRHRHGHQYFLPCVSRLSAFSLSIPCLFLLFLQRAHVKFMPSLHRTPSRQ